MTKVVDFNELWKMKNSAECKKYQDGYENSKKARWFNEIVKGHKERTDNQLAAIKIDPEYTVLDVGAGTGRMAIPLAKQVKTITAIDPSASMLTCLKENMENENLKNIVCINKRWDDIELGKDIEPHDIVIASHSLYMFDIRSALEKMNAASKRSVYLFNFVDDIKGLFWTEDDFWRYITGEVSPSWSDYIYQLVILHELGIHANLKIFNSKFNHKYNNLEEIVDYLKAVYSVPSEKEDLLKNRIFKMVEENGDTILLNGVSKSALIWWDKNNIE